MSAFRISRHQKIGAHSLQHLGIKRRRCVVIEVNGAQDNPFGKGRSLIVPWSNPLSTQAAERQQQPDDEQRDTDDEQRASPESHADNHE